MAVPILFDNILRTLVASFAYKATGQAAQIAAPQSLVLGDEAVLDLYAPADYTTWTTDTGKVGLVIPEPGGRAIAGTWFFRYTEDKTGGTLFSGSRYKIVSYEAGDDFSNVGGSNQAGSVFVASSTTPAVWSNGSVLQVVSADLSYSATAAQVQSALNNMVTPGVSFSVTGDAGGPWRVLADVTDVLSAFVLETGNLYPQCNGSARRVQQGDGLSKYEQLRVSLKQAALTLTSSFTNLPAGAPDIAELQAGATDTPGPAANAIHSIGLTSYPYGGFFTLTYTTGFSGTTPPIPVGATAAAVQEAIESIAGDDAVIVVRQTAPNYYRVEYLGDLEATVIAVPTMTISGVTFAVGRRVTLDLATNNLHEYLEGQQRQTALLEIEMDGDDTPLQAFLQVVNDGIDNDTTTSTATDDPVTDGQVGVLMPAWRHDIASLTGGGATALDGISTVDLPIGYRVDLALGSVGSKILSVYVLENSTAAESSPGVVRPDDYDGSSNAKVWFQIA
jgi:hypothetical protein